MGILNQIVTGVLSALESTSAPTDAEPSSPRATPPPPEPTLSELADELAAAQARTAEAEAEQHVLEAQLETSQQTLDEADAAATVAVERDAPVTELEALELAVSLAKRRKVAAAKRVQAATEATEAARRVAEAVGEAHAAAARVERRGHLDAQIETTLDRVHALHDGIVEKIDELVAMCTARDAAYADYVDAHRERATHGDAPPFVGRNTMLLRFTVASAKGDPQKLVDVFSTGGGFSRWANFGQLNSSHHHLPLAAGLAGFGWNWLPKRSESEINPHRVESLKAMADFAMRAGDTSQIYRFVETTLRDEAKPTAAVPAPVLVDPDPSADDVDEDAPTPPAEGPYASAIVAPPKAAPAPRVTMLT